MKVIFLYNSNETGYVKIAFQKKKNLAFNPNTHLTIFYVMQTSRFVLCETFFFGNSLTNAYFFTECCM